MIVMYVDHGPGAVKINSKFYDSGCLTLYIDIFFLFFDNKSQKPT